MRHRLALLAASILVLAITPALAQTTPVEVFAETFIAVTQPGFVGEAGCAVENTTSDTTVDILLTGTVTYADGTTDRIIGPFRTTLEPGMGFVVIPLFLIPEDTALGTATFTCAALVTRIQGGTGHGDYPHPLQFTDLSTFEVVAP